MITFNNHQINKIYYGNKEIKTIYSGSNLIFNAFENSIDNKFKNYLLDPLTYSNYLLDSYILSNNGSIASQSGYKASDFIEIPPNCSIYFYTPIGGGYPYHCGAIYDKNKNFIKGIRADANEGFYHLNGVNTIKTTENAKYIRVTCGSNGEFPSIYIYTNYIKSINFNHESNNIYHVDNVSSLLGLDLKIGDKAITSGYYTIDDNGGASYEIISYDEWYSLLPDDIKLITKDNKYIPTPVDEFGNHTLNNGLVAKLITKNTDEMYITTPEQWGAKGDGKTNDIWPFIHMFAQTKTGKILFNSNSTYIMGLTGDSIYNCSDNPYRAWLCGSFLGGQLFFKPIMANVNNLELIGNNCLITIPDGQWGTSGMGIWNFCGNINNLNISGFKFDGKSSTIAYKQKNSNHTLFYATGSFGTNLNGRLLDLNPRFNTSTNEFDKVSINNWNITNNEFKNSGTLIRDGGDYGGDFILLVSPDSLNGLNIEDNKFLYWGRWVFSIDLLGNGERLYNIKFNRNYCRGDNSSEAPKITGWNWRGLGLIDFESKKCFTNIEMIDNDIEGQGGFAINGNSKLSENIIIKNNHWVHTGGGYPYMFNCYSGYLQNIIFENNYLSGSSNRLGIATKNAYIKNNTGNLSFRIDNLYGDIIFDNNIGIDPSNQILYINNSTSSINNFFSNTEDCNLIFTNNTGGINAYNMIFLPNIQNIKFNYKNNKSSFLQINAFNCKEFDFNPKEILNYTLNFMVRGATFTSPSYSKTHDPIIGSAIYNEGDICTTDLYNMDVLLPTNYYYNLFDNLSKYNNNTKSYFNSKGIKEAGLRCTKSGYFPSAGCCGFRYQDTKFEPLLNVQANAYIFTDDSLYIAINDGVLGDELPTHKSDIKENGTVNLMYICELGKAEIFKIS